MSWQSVPPEERQDERIFKTPLHKKVLDEKAVYSCGVESGERTFMAFHEAKVCNASYETKHIRSRGQDGDIHFGTLTMGMYQNRQRMDEVRVGILDVRSHISPGDVDALAAWARYRNLLSFFLSFSLPPLSLSLSDMLLLFLRVCFCCLLGMIGFN